MIAVIIRLGVTLECLLIFIDTKSCSLNIINIQLRMFLFVIQHICFKNGNLKILFIDVTFIFTTLAYSWIERYKLL